VCIAFASKDSDQHLHEINRRNEHIDSRHIEQPKQKKSKTSNIQTAQQHPYSPNSNEMGTYKNIVHRMFSWIVLLPTS
jgi:hypothetical protein